MADEWIEKLAQGIRQKNHEAAEEDGRNQHYAGIIGERSNEFFLTLVDCMQNNVDAIRSQLQGDSTAAETSVETGGVKADGSNEIRITRARFPWVDARLVRREDTITLDYAKDPGIKGDPKLDRVSKTFAFRVAPDDSLFVEDAFADQPRKYTQAEELAHRITELLFAA